MTCRSRFVQSCLVGVVTSLLALSPIRGQQTPTTGQISGHIYRADTGAPLANAVVTAQHRISRTPVLTTTAADGSYIFKNLPAGAYHVAGSRDGFVGAFYRIPPTRNNDFPPIEVLAGGNVSGIDIRLDPAPRITAISLAALHATYPGVGIQFAMGSFSPDGSRVALAISGVKTGDPEQAWIYDMRTQRMVAVTESPLNGRDPGIASLDWDADGTLYVQARRRQLVGSSYIVAATMTKIEEIAEIPPRARFPDRRVSFRANLTNEISNDRFFARSERRESGGDFHLSGGPKGGGPFPDIDRGNWNLVTFILEDSRVIYLKSDRAAAAMTAVDLITRRPQKLFSLPNWAELRILDLSRDGRQFLYTVTGPCRPDLAATKGALLFLNPDEPRPRSVCVAMAPEAARR
jgi:hypothetical protein